MPDDIGPVVGIVLIFAIWYGAALVEHLRRNRK